jgi:serine/threonine protein kinase
MAYINFQVVAFKGLEPYRLSGVTVTDEELGTGSYATVLKLDYLGLKCAGKKIHKVLLGEEADSMTYTVRRFKDECKILSQVRHPNIVQFLGVFYQQGDYIPILIMEYLPLNLDQCIENHYLPNDVRCSILHDVALGLHYLHSQQSPIVHRDLSSNNVLLTSNIRAKISDLGVARILNLSPQKVTHLTKAPGTPAFMPPEVMIADPKYDTSVDVFSYGILMIHILSGQIPIPQIEPIRTEGDRLIPVSEAERRESFLEAIGKDHPLMELILKCIHNNPGMRTNTSEIISQLADMVERNPTQFASQLDMIEYIDRLEEQSEKLKGENLDYRNSQELEKAKQMKEIISKLEKKQEEDQLEAQTLLQTVDHAIDSLKSSLTDEIRKAVNFRAQSTSRDLDELREELKRVESSTAASPPSSAQCQQNTLPTPREKSGVAKSKHVQIVSDTLPASVKHCTKAKQQKAVLQVNKQPEIYPPQEWIKPHHEDQSAKVDEMEASKNREKLSATATSDSETLANEKTVQSHSKNHQRRTHTRSSSISTAKQRADAKRKSRSKSVSVGSSTDTKVGLQMRSSPTGTAEETVDTKSQFSQSRLKPVSVDSPSDDTSASRHPQKQVSKLPPLLQGKSQGPPPVPQKNRERRFTVSMSELDVFTREDTRSREFTASEVIEKVNGYIINKIIVNVPLNFTIHMLYAGTR